MEGFVDGGAPDLAQLHATMLAIERACLMNQMHVNPSTTEAVLVSFQQSPRPYQSCKYILENSHLPCAKFVAAGAIRDAALREWAFLADEDKKNLISLCMNFVTKPSTATEGYFQAKVSSVAAQLFKRGCMEFSTEWKESFFVEVKHLVVGSHGLEAQISGLKFLESMVSEFSVSTSSSLGLPIEFHKQCKDLLEMEYLKNFYCWARDAALMVTDRILEHDASLSEDNVCSAALNVMFQIMNWDFKLIDSSRSASNSRTKQDSLALKFERTFLQPGWAWHDVLISSGHIAWLLVLYGNLRKRFLHDVLWFDSAVAVSCRQLIVQLCSLSGTIFDNEQSHGNYLLQILSAITEWIDPPDATIAAINSGRSEREMLDGCHALLSIASLTCTATFDNLMRSLRPFGTIQLLSNLTSEVAKTLGATDDEERIWCSEAFDILLETWNGLLGAAGSNDKEISIDGKDACARLFNSLVINQLKAAAASAFEDDEESDHFLASISSRDERLSSISLIGRAAPDVTLPLLSTLFSERCQLLSQGKGKIDLTRTLEELYWLILISGHILADSGQGETVMVPDAFLVPFFDVNEASRHPVIALSGSVMNFAEWSLNPELRVAFFSPRLMEALVWFLARWSDTYLMPQEATEKSNQILQNGDNTVKKSQVSRKTLLNFAGENSHGKHLVDTFVHISVTALTSYPGETMLQELTCQKLLPALVRRRNVCVQLVSQESWHNLANAFANDMSWFSLASRLHRSLAETLVDSASAIKDPNLSNQYVRDLMGSTVMYLMDICSKNDIKTIALQPDTLLLISCLLERLRGVARATEPRTQKAIFDVSVAVMDPLCYLMDVYRDEAMVVYMILKFSVDLVEGQIVFLSPEDTAALIRFCMQLLQIYSSHNSRKISLSLSAGLLNEAKAEKYKDLSALLQLLTNLCSKDLVDFSSSSHEESADIAQVVYMGLHIVIPLMSSELLKYTKLCHKYFALISHMLEVYPEKVTQLNTEAFKQIIATLDWGIRQQDVEVVEMCLRALNALASYHYKEKLVGREGLNMQLEGFQGPNEKPNEGMLSHFLRSLMQLLLFEDFSIDILGAIADALLPLLLCEQELYQELVHEVIERQPNDAVKSRLSSAFTLLTGSNQISSSLDRPNRQKFRKNLNNFFVDVSGFLRTK